MKPSAQRCALIRAQSRGRRRHASAVSAAIATVAVRGRLVIGARIR